VNFRFWPTGAVRIRNALSRSLAPIRIWARSVQIRTILQAMRQTLATLLSAGWLTVNAAEPVDVWLTPPSWAEERHRAEADAQFLAEETARNKSLWISTRTENLTYTLTATDGGLIPLRCNGVPIRITIRKGHALSATYQANVQNCARGHSALRNRDQRPAFTPDEIFQLIEDSSRVPPDVECLKVLFDSKTGLPLKVTGGCPWLSDSSWSIEVSDLSVKR
jgi:hypothetical protein